MKSDRDFDADLLICQEATPETWNILGEKSVAVLRSMFPDKIPNGKVVVIERPPATRQEAMECFSTIILVGQILPEDARFVVAAREGWPAALKLIAGLLTPRPLEEWHEDDGDVLWWKFPIDEPPYCGSPLWGNWPGYHTHWIPIPIPKEPKE